MIGEDFRSRALNNLEYARDLEQQISDLKVAMKRQDETMDGKDLELVLKDRECETYQMQSEEYLSHFAKMRGDRDHL